MHAKYATNYSSNYSNTFFYAPLRIMFIMNSIDVTTKAGIVSLLVEGTSIRTICQITGVSKNCVQRLLAIIGDACAVYQDRVMVRLNCESLRCDQIWSFDGPTEEIVPAREMQTRRERSCHTWVAVDSHTRLIPCWHVGTSSSVSAKNFVDDVVQRLAKPVRLCTDNGKLYLKVVENTGGCDVDEGLLAAAYDASFERKTAWDCSVDDGRRLSEGGASVDRDNAHMSVASAEQEPLVVRTHRSAGSADKFTKKMKTHMQAISLHFMFHNFCRTQRNQPTTPGMAAGIAEHVWELEEIVMMADTMEGVVVNWDSL